MASLKRSRDIRLHQNARKKDFIHVCSFKGNFFEEKGVHTANTNNNSSCNNNNNNHNNNKRQTRDFGVRKKSITMGPRAAASPESGRPAEDAASMPEDEVDLAPVSEAGSDDAKPSPMQIVWRNVILMSLLHLGALYGIYLLPQAKTATIIWAVLLYYLSGLGITAGAHRLWAHRSYKAKLPYRIMLGIFNSLAFQNDIIEWSRDHRVHHKYSETNADPHNAKRGFFFSHVGWLLVRKHPDVKEKGKQLDLSDLFADPVCRIQRKYYLPSVILLCFIIPTIIPVFFFGESAITAYFLAAILRYCATLNATWLVNSAAHIWGWKPYDKFINPAENPAVAIFAAGEGFHNYHHTFPHDYSTAEFGWFLNLSTLFIDIFATLGQVYDRKSMPKQLVYRRRERTGDRMKIS